MNDEQMRPLLKAWFRARSVAPGDVPDGVAQVVARLPQTQQRSRWWPLPGFDRSAPNPTTNGRQPARGFTMFGALKFVVASAILALFGGFLLGGILMTQQGDEMAPAAVTASPSPTTTSDLLSGMVTEEVEPGVYKVVNDGVHSLSPMFQGRVVAGHDGVMYVHLDDGFYRLGDDEMHAWPVRVSGEADDGFAHTIMEVAPNGTVWALLHDGSSDEYSFHSFDGDMWTAHSGSPSDLDVSPSGTVWTVDQDQDDRWVVRFTGDDGASWQTLERIPPSDDAWDNAWLDVADDSDVWTGGLWGLWGPWRYSDGTWQAYEQFLGTNAAGTYWTVDWDEDYQEERLFRSDGAGTRHWSLVELVLDRNPEDMALADMRVTPDGSLWFGWWERLERPPGGGYDEQPVACVGVIRFDGLDLRRYALPSTPDGYDCFDGMDATADGSLWLTMGDDLYVITPEAVTGTE